MSKHKNVKTKTNTNPNPDPNRYRRLCPDPNARIQKFIHYMATQQRRFYNEYSSTSLDLLRTVFVMSSKKNTEVEQGSGRSTCTVGAYI